MKLNRMFLPVLTGSLLAGAAQAQVDLTITGSTSFRSITFDRVKSLFDPGYTSDGNFGTGPGTYSGTMSNSVPSLGPTPVTVRLSFSGSAAGMEAVDAGTPVPTINPITGITNITREQAVLLMSSSGIITNAGQQVFGMPASFLAGSSTNPVYLTGRDSGSGTRISVHKDIGYTGTSPRLWGLDGLGNLVLTNGYSSGGTERTVIANNASVIGYLGVADSGVITASASTISYE